jgi:hypothetical protein
MTLVGSQSSSRNWVGCPPVTVLKEGNRADVYCGAVSAFEEINFYIFCTFSPDH